MDPKHARSIVARVLVGGHGRHAALLPEEVERVAAAVPPEARAVALLHKALEHHEIDGGELFAHGLTDDEAAALTLLVRTPGESHDVYIRRIARAPEPGGRLARAVKAADLEDLRDPRFAGARTRLALARLRWDAKLASPPGRAGLARGLP